MELHRQGWYTRSGKPWGKMTLDYILRNPLYHGKVQLKDQLFPGEHEPLIDEGLFYKVQFLNGELFYTLKEAQIMTDRWRTHYNTVRPHSSLGGQPPAPETLQLAS